MFDAQSDLAGLIYGDGEDADGLLRDFAADLKADGFRVVGLVQSDHRNGAPHLTATLVHTDEDVQLFQDLGPGAKGCRLDAGQLLNAGAHINAALDEGADLVILNRFGKLEREGRGLAYLIERALSADVPVLLAVSEMHFADWIRFSGGMSVKLKCDRTALDGWWNAVIAKRRGCPVPGRKHARDGRH